MDFIGKAVGAKIFVEEMASSGQSGSSATTYCTGRLQEIKNFNSISYSNSAGLDKNFTITLRNPGNIVTTSIVTERGVSRPRPGQADVDHNGTYAQTLYDKRARSFDPFDASTSDPNQKYLGVALRDELVYGVSDGAPNLTTMSDLPTYMLGEMQRIWVILKTEFDDDRQPRYTMIAGIISGFNEGHSVDGEASFTISCVGVSRFLELSRVHTKQFYGAYYKTQSELFAEKVLKPVLDLMSSALGGGFLAANGPMASMLYSAWVTNASFSWLGRTGNYFGKDLDNAARTGTGVYPGMFLQLPLWKLSAGLPKAPEQIKNSLQSLTSSTEIDEAGCNAWGNALAVAFGKTNSQNFISPRSRMFVERDERENFAAALYEGRELSTGNVTAADLLPGVYYDDLIKKLYLDDSDSLQLFEKRISSTFELFAVSAMTAREILEKMAQAALGVVREDDQGNLIFELPRYWEAPAQTAGQMSHVNIKEYADWLYENQITITKEPRGGPDYIIDGSNFKSRSLSSSEANIVTHVETPCNTQYVEFTEVIKNFVATGYSGQMFKDAERVAYIEYLERRYGYRPFTAPPINSNGTTFGDDNGNAVRLKVAMDLFADAMLDFRNYSRHQCSFNISYAPWLDCGRNVFVMGRGELWMINSKTVIYNIGETSGEASTSLSCSHGHYLTERVGYSYLDAIIKAETVQAYANVVATDNSLTNLEEAAVQQGAPTKISDADSYDDIIRDAAATFVIPWDLPKAVFLHESGMKQIIPTEPHKATGIGQLFPAAVKDVKLQWPSMSGLDMLKATDNIWLGVGYLKICLNDCHNNIYFSLFGYNRGRTTGREQYEAAVAFYKRPPTREESSKWLNDKFPTKDKHGSLAGNGYPLAVARQFRTVANPDRNLWDAVNVSVWPPKEDTYPYQEGEQPTSET